MVSPPCPGELVSERGEDRRTDATRHGASAASRRLIAHRSYLDILKRTTTNPLHVTINMSSIAGQQSSASVASPNPASSLPPSWTAAAPVKPTKLHELIAACTALPTQKTTPGDGDDDDEEFGGGAAISMWQPVMNRIYTHPGECRRKDQRQRNPLHCAVARLPPPCIVRALIEASSAAGVNGEDGHSILLEKDNRGATPLNRAAEHGASVGCIRALLAANSESASIPDRSGRLPLHWSCCNGFSESSSGAASSSAINIGKASSTSTQLMTKMKKQKREVVRLLLEASPEGACRADVWHRRPLDGAIDARCCPEIIEMLVKACPAAVSEDESGCTPLASAIQNGLCADIIRILVDTNPSALKVADGSGLPLRKALEYQASPSVIDILACDAETVTAADSMGRSSLHLALQWSAYNFSVVKILLEKAPHAAMSNNKQGQTPLRLAYLHFCRSVRGVKEVNREILDNSQVVRCWQTTLLLLRAATNEDGGDERSKENRNGNGSTEFKVLHSMLRTEVSMPLVQACLAYRPSEVLQLDRNGSSALSCAICGPIKSAKSRIIDTIFNCNASALRVADLNDGLRLPLAQAALRSRQIKGLTMKALMDAYPDAIFAQDQVTGFYPFQLAALPQSSNDRSDSSDSIRDHYLQWGWDDDEEAQQTNAIFELLRAAPGLIAHDITKRSSCTIAR